ncbi:hypothetical protein C8A05DRAFT_20055 [Staphylotrichum tortipilum]|uniref:Uncharacterized protein n=1 Tax=Staphylotrichum tortipilum TaxID=2831512 RepID=A0AAN6MBN9_9PEZI|nr:hypothetical protein C8A05DRAFT_20055 [Staphylotrichum longicolle]
MEFKPNDDSITSESAPLIEPVDCESDRDLFMVPLKRPSPRLTPSRYRNVKPRTPPRSPLGARSPCSNPAKSPQPGSQLSANPYQSPAMSGHTIQPASPPMFTSPLMSPESGALGANGSPNLQDSIAQRSIATPGSLGYNSPPMSGRGTKVGSSPDMSTSAGQSQHPAQSSSKEKNTSASRSTGDRRSPSTKASSVYDSPPAIEEPKPEPTTITTQPPSIPPLSAARRLHTKSPNLGLALQLSPVPHAGTSTPSHLLPPAAALPTPHGTNFLHPPKSPLNWTVPDSPLDRLSQLRATPDSAYDRARQMEVRRSEWKHVVYRFPVHGASDWVIDADLTESSHARLADVARRSSEGFEWNGDYELAGVYRVLAAAHGRVVEEMRGERRGIVGAAAVGAAR